MNSRTTTFLTLGAAAAIVLFAALALVIYRMLPTPGTIFLVLGWMSILATGYFLVRAVNSASTGVTVLEDLSGDRRDELVREKKLLLKAIKEVEFDRDTGKLESAEAQGAIARYRARAVEIIRELDEDPSRRYEAEIERELVRRLAAEPAVAGGCPACGAANDDDAAFCKKCGARLEARS